MTRFDTKFEKTKKNNRSIIYRACLGNLALALHARHAAGLVVDNLLDGAVQHVRAAIDGRQTVRECQRAHTLPCKALGQLTQTVQGVQVRRIAVASNGLAVQLDLAAM